MASRHLSRVATWRFLSLAFVKAFHDRRAPWYQHGLIRKPPRKIGMILLHDVEHRFRGELAMIVSKQSVHSCELFIGHGLAPSRRRHAQTVEAMVKPHSTIMARKTIGLGLVSSFRSRQCLLDFSAAVRALVDEVDFRHAPVGLDVSYVHGKS
jgi:hypothetical protein